MTGAIQKATERSQIAKGGEPKNMQQYIKKMESEIAKALPSVMTPERFTRITLSALSANQKLQETTPQSFLGAMMTAAQLGVEPNTPLGQAYLIPYRNKGVMECQFQLGYKGLIDLAYRSGEISVIQAKTVYEGDTFTYSFGLEPELKHIPCQDGEKGEVTHFYAMFRTKDGGYGFDVMTVDEVRAHARKFSKSFSNGPWQTNFEEMAKKTVLKKVLKYAPMKSDFVRGITQDETVHKSISDDMFSEPTIYIEADEDVKDIPDSETEVQTEIEAG